MDLQFLASRRETPYYSMFYFLRRFLLKNMQVRQRERKGGPIPLAWEGRWGRGSRNSPLLRFSILIYMGKNNSNLPAPGSSGKTEKHNSQNEVFSWWKRGWA